jgi:hypothetical protein
MPDPTVISMPAARHKRPRRISNALSHHRNAASRAGITSDRHLLSINLIKAHRIKIQLITACRIKKVLMVPSRPFARIVGRKSGPSSVNRPRQTTNQVRHPKHSVARRSHVPNRGPVEMRDASKTMIAVAITINSCCG